MNLSFDLKRFGSALSLIEIGLDALESDRNSLAQVATDYGMAMAAYEMMASDQQSQVIARLTEIQQRLAALTEVEQAAIKRFALLETFFAAVVRLTIEHRVDYDGDDSRAWVAPSDLGAALEKVDPLWHEKEP